MEAESNDISIESILRGYNSQVTTLDLGTSLQIIDHQLRDYRDYESVNPIVDLCILDSIDKWVYRENNIDIHHTIQSVVFECIKGTDLRSRFDNYLHGGPYPMISVMFDLKVLLDAVAWLDGRRYQGET